MFSPIVSNDKNYDDNSSINVSTTNNNTIDDNAINQDLWKEISRPQIHGYDLMSIAISPSNSSYLLYSSADEKLIRVFDAPSTVIEGLDILGNIQNIKNEKNIKRDNSVGIDNEKKMDSVDDINENGGFGKQIDDEGSSVNRVRRAYIPELGIH